MLHHIFIVRKKKTLDFSLFNFQHEEYLCSKVEVKYIYELQV